MKNLKQPKTQLEEVLFMLLTRKSINVRQMMFDTGILNLSARLSDLKIFYNLPIDLKKVYTVNKFSRKINYGSWELLDKEKGINVYNKL